MTDFEGKIVGIHVSASLAGQRCSCMTWGIGQGLVSGGGGGVVILVIKWN